LCRGEIGTRKVEGEQGRAGKAGINRAFNRCPFRNATRGRHVDDNLRAICPFCAQPANGKITLRHGINLAIGTDQRCQDQAAAAQGLGLAKGGDSDVDPLAGLGKGGQFSGDQHSG